MDQLNQGLHTCNECGRCFRNPEQLQVHYGIEHFHWSQKPCSKCSKMFSTDEELERHYALEHPRISQIDMGDLDGQSIQQGGNACLDAYSPSLPQTTPQGSSMELDTLLTGEQLSASESNVGLVDTHEQNISQGANDNLHAYFPSERPRRSKYNRDILKGIFRKSAGKSKDKKDKPNAKSEATLTLLKCPKCERYFANKRGLSQHSRVHKPTVLQCQFCKKPYKRERDLKKHMERLKHFPTGMPYQCQICSKYFKWLPSLKHHMKKFHNSNGGKKRQNVKSHTVSRPPDDDDNNESESPTHCECVAVSNDNENETNIRNPQTSTIARSPADDNNESESSKIGESVTVSKDNESESAIRSSQTSTTIRKSGSFKTRPSYDAHWSSIGDNESETSDNNPSEGETHDLTSSSLTEMHTTSGADNESETSEMFNFNDTSTEDELLSIQCSSCGRSFSNPEDVFNHELLCSTKPPDM